MPPHKAKKAAYPCPDCTKTFENRTKLKMHRTSHSEAKPYACVLCANRFKAKQYLSRHVRLRHGPPPAHNACQYCGKTFHFLSKLKQHILVHTGEKPFQCKKCGKSFNTTYSLNTHNFIHTNEKPYRCSYCDYACRDTSTLKKHQDKHTGLQKIYQCTLCDYKYKSKSRLKSHVASDHLSLDLRRNECDTCGAKFKEKGALKNHIQAVHQARARCACAACGATLSSRHNLRAHEARHGARRPYRCGQERCGRAFKTQGDLTKHTRIHYPSLHYRCEICARAFTRPGRLASHVVKRHGQSRAECHYCGDSFVNKSQVLKHIRRKHSGKMKRYTCDACDFTTTNKPSLVMHIKYGHGNKWDKECEFCGKEYRTNKFLSLHLTKCHNGKIKLEPPQLEVKVDIKEEPEDVIDLFEIDKEEPIEDVEMDEGDLNAILESTDIQTGDQIEDLIDINKDSIDKTTAEGHLDQETDQKHDPTDKDQITDQNEVDIMSNADQTNYAHETEQIMLNKDQIHNNSDDAIIIKDLLTQNTHQAKENTDQRSDPMTWNSDRLRKNKNRRTVNKNRKKPDQLTHSSKQKNTIKKRKNEDHVAQNTDENSQRVDRNKDRIRNVKLNRDRALRQAGTLTHEADQMAQNADMLEACDIIRKNKLSLRNVPEKIFDDFFIAHVVKTPANDDKATSKIKRVSKKIVTSKKTIQKPVDTDASDECASSDNGGDDGMGKNKKMNFRTHQCYSCFKLFDTKLKLIDHCKKHFDVYSSDVAIKKCPLCTYVTKYSITRHIRLVHKVEIKVPYGSLRGEWDAKDGKKYYYKINNDKIKQLEVIPSVRHLNKMASNKIDRKNREVKERTILKKKLVKNNGHWSVQVQSVKLNNVVMPIYDESLLEKVKLADETSSYLDNLKKLYHLAKKDGKKMLFPCEFCEKVCLNLAALKLHCRKHDPNKKPFKPKVWKHKIGGTQNNDKKTVDNAPENNVGDENGAKKPVDTDNRNAKPKPIKNNHKCDPELMKFYEENVRGGDVEFWQFLKIFNKMGRENVKDFNDLNERTDFGIHLTVNADEVQPNDKNNGGMKEIADKTAEKPFNVTKTMKTKKLASNKHLWLSKVELSKRNEAKKRLRQKLITEGNE